MAKANKQTWDDSHRHLDTTYKIEDIRTRVDLIQKLFYEYLIETIRAGIDTPVSFRTLEIGCGGARVSVYLARNGADAAMRYKGT